MTDRKDLDRLTEESVRKQLRAAKWAIPGVIVLLVIAAIARHATQIFSDEQSSGD